MRVLIITCFNDRSEVALYLALARAGVELEVICHPDAPEQEVLARGGVRVTLDVVRHRLDLPAARRLRLRMARERYDIVHAPRNATLSAALLSSGGLDVRHIAYRGTIGHLSRLDPACWLTYLNPRLDRIICVSDAVLRYMRRMGLPGHRLVRIYKGHDVAWYDDLPASSPSAFGVPEGAFVLVFTGNVRPVKGVDVLLRAMAHLAESRVHLLLVGEIRDPRVTRLCRDPAIRDRVHLAGFRKDAAALAGAADALVLPSLAREGLPRSVIEAMAQRVPPIVTSVGGLPELVEDRRSGLVVPPGNPAALARAVHLLAGRPDLAAELGHNARERIRATFNIEQTIAQVLRLYRELAPD